MSNPTIDENYIRQIAAQTLGERSTAFLNMVLPKRRQMSDLASFARYATILPVLLKLFQQGAWSNNPGVLAQAVAQTLWAAAGPVSYTQAVARLPLLAFQLVEQRQSRIAAEAAAGVIGEQAVLEQSMAAGLLVVHEGLIRFTHQWLRDYFAAVQLQASDLRPYVFRPVGRHAWDGVGRRQGQWDGAILALYGIGDQRRVIEAVVEQNPFLAAECLLTGVPAAADLRQRVALKLQSLVLHSQTELESELAALLLGQFGHESTPLLLEVLGQVSADRRIRVAEALGLTGDLAAVASLIDHLQHDPDYRVQAEAALALGRLKPPEFVQVLRTFLADLDASPPMPKERSERPRMLVVNDDPDMVNLIKLMLRRMLDIEVMAAYDGTEAVATFRQFQPHAVYMNKSMPTMDGYEATHLILTESPDTPVVIVSASAQPNLTRRCGAAALLSLPQSPDILVRTAQTILDPRFRPPVNVLKQAIAEALGAIGTDEAVQTLVDLRHDRYLTPQIYTTINDALRRIDTPAALAALQASSDGQID